LTTVFFHSPDFFPALPFFYGLANSDVWVVMDHVTFQSRTRQNICRVKTPTGIRLLHVPVKLPCNKPVFETMVNTYTNWQFLFLSALRSCYEDAPYYQYCIDDIKYYLQGPAVMIETLNVQTTLLVANMLKIRPEIVYSQHICSGMDEAETISYVCTKMKADAFTKEFVHPSYQQLWEPFEPNLSVLDALFCVGPDETAKLISRF